MQKLTSNRVAGIAALVFASLTWGTIPLILRYVDGSPFIKVFMRVFVAFVVIGIWLIVSRRWRKITKLDGFTIRWLFAQGGLLALNWVLFFGAFDRTNVATVELLGYMGPVFVALMIPFVLKERFDKRIIIPLLLSLMGMVAVLIPHGFGFSSDLTSQIGALMALGSAFTYALLILMAKRIVDTVSVDLVTVFEALGASLILAPFAWWAFSQGNAPTGGITPYLWLAVLGAVHTAFTGVLFFYGLRLLRADQTAILTYIEPVSAIMFASLFLGEVLTWLTIGGGLLVLVGGAIVARLDAQEGVGAPPIEVPIIEN